MHSMACMVFQPHRPRKKTLGIFEKTHSAPPRSVRMGFFGHSKNLHPTVSCKPTGIKQSPSHSSQHSIATLTGEANPPRTCRPHACSSWQPLSRCFDPRPWLRGHRVHPATALRCVRSLTRLPGCSGNPVIPCAPLTKECDHKEI